MGAVPGQVGLAADLEHSDRAYLSVDEGSQEGLGVRGSLTLVGWMNLESLEPWQVMAAKYEFGRDDRAYRLDMRAADRLGLIVSPDGSFDGDYLLTAVLPAPLQIGQWYHVAGVFDAAARTLSIYLDGELVATRAVNYGKVYESSAPFTLGADVRWGSAVQHFDGQLDEWHVFAEALSQSEVQALMATTP